MTFNEIKALDNEYIAGTYARFDLAIQSGKGAKCQDYNGKSYVDFTSGIGVNCLGWCDEKWSQAVGAAAQSLSHTCNLYYTQGSAVLAEKLCTKSGYSKVFFANSGAEANECAIKAARKYSADKYSADRCEIITLVNSFHGRTITTLAATGQEVFHNKFTPLTEGFSYAEANNINDFRQRLSNKTCGVMLELIQGEGGVIPLDKAFVAELYSICKENDILLIADEVQTGAGRTGTFLASEQYGIKPDITTMAKGLGGGLPIGAVLFSEKCKAVLGAGDHGSTFGANPIVCAGALEVINRLDHKLLLQVKEKGEYIKQRLLKIKNIEDVSGMGLMLGVKLRDGISAKTAVAECIKNGALFLTAKEKMRLLPPLTISYEEIDEGLSVLEKVINNL